MKSYSFLLIVVPSVACALLLTATRCEAFQSIRKPKDSGLGRLRIAPADNNTPTALFQSSTPEDNNTDKAAKVRFSASATTENSSPLDAAISILSSDIASIGLGLLGLCLLILERIFLPDAETLGENQVQYAEKLGEETRSNLIAVIACGSVLLNGLSKLDVTSALAESVVLEGTVLSEPVWFADHHKNTILVDSLNWAMASFLRATPAKTVAILQTNSNNNNQWQVLSMMGTVPTDAGAGQQPIVLSSTPILDRCQKPNSGETYLPTLQALPGKTEFTYLPENTQGVLILPVPSSSSVDNNGGATVIVLGANCAKIFTPRDVAWCQTIAARLGFVASQ